MVRGIAQPPAKGNLEYEDRNMNKQAFCSWEKDIQEGCYLVAHLWVPVEQRGQGLGRKLLREAIAEMKADGEYDVIKLSADSNSEDPENPIDAFELVAFYESEGFDIEYAGEVVVMAMSI